MDFFGRLRGQPEPCPVSINGRNVKREAVYGIPWGRQHGPHLRPEISGKPPLPAPRGAFGIWVSAYSSSVSRTRARRAFPAGADGRHRPPRGREKCPRLPQSTGDGGGRSSSSRGQPRGMGSAGGPCARRGRFGADQKDAEAGALPKVAFHFDGAFQFLNEPEADGQSQADAVA